MSERFIIKRVWYRLFIAYLLLCHQLLFYFDARASTYEVYLRGHAGSSIHDTVNKHVLTWRNKLNVLDDFSLLSHTHHRNKSTHIKQFYRQVYVYIHTGVYRIIRVLLFKLQRTTDAHHIIGRIEVKYDWSFSHRSILNNILI